MDTIAPDYSTVIGDIEERQEAVREPIAHLGTGHRQKQNSIRVYYSANSSNVGSKPAEREQSSWIMRALTYLAPRTKTGL
jgi:hypothetical protein